jgi:hypothetical protein
MPYQSSPAEASYYGLVSTAARAKYRNLPGEQTYAVSSYTPGASLIIPQLGEVPPMAMGLAALAAAVVGFWLARKQGVI